MATRIALRHLTRYRYDRDVWLSPHVVRLAPAPHCRIPVSGYSLRTTPEDPFLHWQQDPYGNRQARLVFREKTRELSLEVALTAGLEPFNPFDFFVEGYAERVPFAYEPLLARGLPLYLSAEPGGPAFSAFVAEARGRPDGTIDFLVRLNREVCRRVRYLVRPEPGIRTPEETLAQASGSCRDSAWLLVQVLRHLGLAARFVSGYLIQLDVDGSGRDDGELHAWAEAYVPGAGWIGMDPTSGLLTGEGHLPLACAAEPAAAAPVTGTYSLYAPGSGAPAPGGPASVAFDASVTVARVL